MDTQGMVNTNVANAILVQRKHPEENDAVLECRERVADEPVGPENLLDGTASTLDRGGVHHNCRPLTLSPLHYELLEVVIQDGRLPIQHCAPNA
jgi:hypothetical protein